MIHAFEAWATNSCATSPIEEKSAQGCASSLMGAPQSTWSVVGPMANEPRPGGPKLSFNFYSVGKAIVALLALRLVDRGLLGLDEPVVSVWPEFAEVQAAVTLRQALCHRAAVPAIRQPMTNADLWRWERMARALAASDPWWEPGTRHTYHTNTYGHLIGEIIRRVSGETLWRSPPISGRPTRRRCLVRCSPTTAPEMCRHRVEWLDGCPNRPR